MKLLAGKSNSLVSSKNGNGHPHNGNGRAHSDVDGNFPRNADGCAGLLLETVPLIMATMRELIQNAQSPDLTVAQFRTLMFIHRQRTANLSDAAVHLGLALPSASKLVDQLVKRHFLGRQSDSSDRRRMVLRVTARGDALLKDAHALVRKRLASHLNTMGQQELNMLHKTLGILQLSLPSLSEQTRKDRKLNRGNA